MASKKTVEIVWRLPIGDKINEIRNYVGDFELDQYIEDTTKKYGWIMDEVFLLQGGSFI